MRLRATAPNHVLSYAPRYSFSHFIFIRDAYGGKIRMLTMTNEFAKKCWTMHRTRRIRAIQVIEQLANAMMIQSIPEYIPRDDNPEFITKDLLSWLSGIGVKNTYIEPGSPRENGFCKSFNITFRGNLFGWKNLLQLEGSTGHRWGLDQAL